MPKNSVLRFSTVARSDFVLILATDTTDGTDFC